MWWDKRVPIRVKRTLFRGAVCGASLTGLIALLLQDRDCLRLQRCLEKKLLFSCSARVHGKDRTTSGPSALDKCGKGGDWRHPRTNCACRDSGGTRASPENQQGTHISSVAGWGESTSKCTIRSSMVNVCIPRQTDTRNDHWRSCRHWHLFPSGRADNKR